jgi:hypothetical protein
MVSNVLRLSRYLHFLNFILTSGNPQKEMVAETSSRHAAGLSIEIASETLYGRANQNVFVFRMNLPFPKWLEFRFHN